MKFDLNAATQASCRRGGLWPALALSILLPAMASAGVSTTVQLFAVANAAIYEPPFGDPPQANGAGVYLFLGRTGGNAGFTIRRSFIRFDIAGAIPAGAVIDLVELDVFVSQIPPSGGGFQTQLLRVSTLWNEGPADSGIPGGLGAPPSSGDTTWMHTNFDSEFWISEGGDFVSDASASVLMTTTGPYTFGSVARGNASLENDVQMWLDDPAMNFGWVLRGVEEFGTASARRVDSRHNDGNPPVLRVTFTAPDGGGGPGPLAVPSLSNVGLVVLFLLLGVAGWWTLRIR